MASDALQTVPMRRPRAGDDRSMPERIFGAAAALAAQAALVGVLLYGVTVAVAPTVEEPLTVAVQTIEPEMPKVQPLAAPQLAVPTMLTMPLPLIEIAAPPAPAAIQAAPPAPVAPVAKPVPATRTAMVPAGEGTDDYFARLLAHLNKHKRYPASARAARIEGVVVIRFVMDRRGNVAMREITKSSGRPVLDREALTLTDRAQPLPSVPADIAGDRLDLEVPIHFSLR